MAYLGLDIGTSGVKAVTVGTDGTVIAEVTEKYSLLFPREKWVELNPREVWVATEKAVAGVAQQTEENIEAVSTASIGEAAVLLDARGEPVCNSIYYTDVRGADLLDTIARTVDVQSLQNRTGMPLNYMYTLPKLLWLQRYRPETLEKTGKILLFGSYIQYMLTGVAAIDRSLASRSLLYNRFADTWDEEICSAFHINSSWLPTIVPAGEIVGKVRKSLAEQLGLSPETVAVSGVHDQIAAALGMGVLRAGEIADGVGSTECFTAPLPSSPDYVSMFRDNFCAEPYIHGESYVTIAFLSTAGSALQWYTGTFEPELLKDCAKKQTNIYDILNAQTTEEPGPLLLLPYFSGSGTPYMDGHAKALLYGLSLNTSRIELYKAIYEGMNFELRLNLDCLKRSGIHTDVLIAGGGGASMEALQLKSTILQKPIWKLENTNVGTIGLTMLCAAALNRFSCVEEAAEYYVKRDVLIEPKHTYESEYSSKYEQYKKLYEAVRILS